MKILVEQKPVIKMKNEYVLLNPALSLADLATKCNEAIEHNIEQVSVPPLLVKKTAELLSNTNIKVAAIIGYPFGWNVIESKLADSIMAIVDGATELEVFINLTALKNNDWQYLAKELSTILTVVNKQQRLLNIVIDPQWLSQQDLQQCCDLYGVAGISCFTVFSAEGNDIAKEVTTVRNHLADAVAVRLVSISEKSDSEAISRYGKIVK